MDNQKILYHLRRNLVKNNGLYKRFMKDTIEEKDRIWTEPLLNFLTENVGVLQDPFASFQALNDIITAIKMAHSDELDTNGNK